MQRSICVLRLASLHGSKNTVLCEPVTLIIRELQVDVWSKHQVTLMAPWPGFVRRDGRCMLRNVELCYDVSQWDSLVTSHLYILPLPHSSAPQLLLQPLHRPGRLNSSSVGALTLLGALGLILSINLIRSALPGLSLSAPRQLAYFVWTGQFPPSPSPWSPLVTLNTSGDWAGTHRGPRSEVLRSQWVREHQTGQISQPRVGRH